MRFRTFLNSLKESFKNIVRHPLVALASITTIALMLTILGGFVTVSYNAKHIAANIGKKPPIEVWIKLDTEQKDIDAVDMALKNDPNVAEYRSITPEENFQTLKKEMGPKSDVLKDFDGNKLLPHLFTVRLNDPDKSAEFESQIMAYPGVSRVDYSSRVMRSLSSMIRWVNIGTLFAFAFLAIIALFIISNMVRIAVLARGEEISIMKYVGATKSYIRMPYVLEGGFAGLLGAIISSLLVYFGYEAIYVKLMANTSPSSFYALLHVQDIILPVVVVSVVLGVFIGAVGSFFSVRKYIKV